MAVAFAHISLLLLLTKFTHKLTRIVFIVTTCMITIVALMVIYIVYLEFAELTQLYYRLLFTFAVLDILGTITIPILTKLNGSSSDS